MHLKCQDLCHLKRVGHMWEWSGSTDWSQVILPSTKSSWLNVKSFSKMLKNVKQKQAPERQTDWFQSRNLQPVSNVNTHTKKEQSPSLKSLPPPVWIWVIKWVYIWVNTLHLSSFCWSKCNITTTSNSTALQSAPFSTWQQWVRLALNPKQDVWEEKNLALHTEMRQSKSKLCILSNQHNFHSLRLLLSAEMEGVRNERVQLQEFVVSVCSGLLCCCVVSYHTSNSSCSFSHTLSLPTSILYHLLPIHSLPFCKWLSCKSVSLMFGPVTYI